MGVRVVVIVGVLSVVAVVEVADRRDWAAVVDR